MDDEYAIQTQYEALEKEINEVLKELSSDPSLEKFRIEYEKIYKYLKTSHDNERLLIRKCKDLNSEIFGNAAKVQTAIKLSSEDAETINSMKARLEENTKLIDLMKAQESNTEQKKQNIHNEIKSLQNLIDQNNQTSGQNITIRDLLLVQEELKKEIAMLQQVIGDLKKNLQVNQERQQKLESERNEIVTEINKINEQLKDTEEKIIQDDQRKKNIQDDLENLKRDYDEQRKNFDSIAEEKQTLKNERDEKQKLFHKRNQEFEQMKKEVKILEKQRKQAENKLMDETQNLSQFENILFERKAFLVQKEHDLKAAENDLQLANFRLQKEKEEVQELNKKLQEAELIKDLTKQSVNELEGEVNQSKKVAFDDHTMIDDLKRMRDTLLKELNKAENNNRKQADDLHIKDKIYKEKDNEISGMLKEQERMRKKIAMLDKEKEKYGQQAAQANAKYFHSLEEIKLKNNLISEFQKKNIETEAKLKQQQNLYEAVRSDRNLYSKNLTETQEECAEFNRKYKIVTYQINQLKEEIGHKDKDLENEHFNHKELDKNIESRQKEIEKLKKNRDEKDIKINEFKKQISKLHYIIKESETQRKKIQEEYDLVVAERDILGTQLIRRNQEANLLNEKIKINQSQLQKAEGQYRERLGDIEQLKIKIAKSMRKIKKFKIQANQIDDLNNEIHNLEKEFIEEKLKVKALSEEIENPINVHRWRKLEATDSETYELMTKIHTLQKRLIIKTEEVRQKEEFINQKEKQLKELREIMKRQPGIEEAKMIPIYQESLNKKSNQLQAMSQELNMYQNQVKDYKFEIERLSGEVQNIKKKYFEQKKREQYERDISNSSKPQLIQINLPEKRFTGGGFNLSN